MVGGEIEPLTPKRPPADAGSVSEVERVEAELKERIAKADQVAANGRASYVSVQLSFALAESLLASLTALRGEQEQLRQREAEAHDVLSAFVAAADPDDPVLDKLVANANRILGAESPDGHCGNPICAELSRLQAAEATGEAAVSQLRSALLVKADEWDARARVLKDEHFTVAAEELRATLDAVGAERTTQRIDEKDQARMDSRR